MLQQVKIKGMTCGGCIQLVKSALSKVEGVIDVVVNLNPPQAVIQSERGVNEMAVQSVLSQAGSYEIGEEASSKSTSGRGGCCG